MQYITHAKNASGLKANQMKAQMMLAGKEL